MNPTRDDEHDAWLREALRHAPDAQARPPSEVSARILREAQARARRGSMQWRPWAALARAETLEAFCEFVGCLRAEAALRNDDVTLVRLEVEP